MLIGYSVDSDILLTTRVLKRQGKLNDKLAGAFHTGIIMTSTTLAAVTVLLIVSWIGQVEVVEEISGSPDGAHLRYPQHLAHKCRHTEMVCP